MLVALLVSPVAAQTIDPINGFAIEPFNPACTLDGGPTSIIAGRDGNLWFTERFGNKIGRIAPTSGLITEFCQVLTAGNPSGITGSPRGITVGPDGNIWFAEVSGVIGRITSVGVITEFASDLIRDSGPFAITAGRDGNLWFTEFFGNRIAQITPAGVVTEFPPLPNPAPLNGPRAITAGPDGNLWFTEYYGNRIGRVTPAGVITEFPPLSSPTSLSGPDSITVGPDGNLWFTEDSGNKIGRITPAGVITEFPLPPNLNCPPNGSNSPLGITAGPDGNLWFTESNGNKVGRVTFAGPPVTPPPVTPPPVIPPPVTPPPPTVPPTDPPADPAAMIRDLMASVEGSYLKGNIREGFERSLYAKLRNALAAVKGQRPDPVACNALTAFSNEVQAQSGKQLTGEQANQLIRAASDIVTRLGCPTRG